MPQPGKPSPPGAAKFGGEFPGAFGGSAQMVGKKVNASVFCDMRNRPI